MIIGDDAALAAMLIWSLPVAQLDGFLVLGSATLAHLARLTGCRGFIEADLSAPSERSLAILETALAGRSAILLPADDAGCNFLARLGPCSHLSAPISTPEVLATLRDKWAFYELCTRLDLPTPPTRRFEAKADIEIETLLAAFGGRIAVKPTDLHGGQGVAEVDSVQSFRTQVLDNPDYRFSPLIAQPWVSGHDLDVSVLARDGEILHWAIQVHHGRRIEFVPNNDILEAARRLVRETRFSGLAHFDARLDDKGQVFLLECNARPWASLGQASWAGLNFVAASVDAALAKAPSQPAQLCAGRAPHLLDWWIGMGITPWRWRGLPEDRKRLALGALLSFAALGWAGRWSKFKARFARLDR